MQTFHPFEFHVSIKPLGSSVDKTWTVSSFLTNLKNYIEEVKDPQTLRIVN